MRITKTIVAIFSSHEQAEEAVKELNKSGFNMEKLSIIGKGYHTEDQPIGFYTSGDRMKSWGGFGAFWGGLWGLLIGAAFFWIPGIGLIGVGGPFIHMIVITLEGAALGGGLSILGAALSSWGIPKDSVIKYEKRIKSNEFLLMAQGTEEEINQAHEILEAGQAAETEVFSHDQE